MRRNLDIATLRSFVTVAETGGVTRAAGYLNLTQSAVSMQLKRLEEALDTPIFDRSGRSLVLTTAGEQLLRYARRIIELNDEAVTRVSSRQEEGSITLGVPHDIVFPAIPEVLRQFAAKYPRAKVKLLSSFTTVLKPQFARGEADVILTTETTCDPDGETIATLPLVWMGAPGGHAHKERPLKLAFEKDCIFRRGVQAALDAAGVDWEMAVDAESFRTVGAIVRADLAVHALLDRTAITDLEPIRDLPPLESFMVNLYAASHPASQMRDDLIAMLRFAFSDNLSRY